MKKKEILKTTIYYASDWWRNLSLQAILTCQLMFESGKSLRSHPSYGNLP